MFMARIAAQSEEKQAPFFASDEARWQAVRERDRAADGVFFYGVKTTGVFCRPSCSARLAKRENVSFHRFPEGAAKRIEACGCHVHRAEATMGRIVRRSELRRPPSGEALALVSSREEGEPAGIAVTDF